jgi:hypothetical protein
VHPRKGQRPKFSTNRGVAADHDAPPKSSRNLLPNCAIGSLNPPSPPLHYIMADEPATQPRLASPPSTHEITHPPIGKGSRGAIRDYTRLPTARPQSSARIPAQSRRGSKARAHARDLRSNRGAGSRGGRRHNTRAVEWGRGGEQSPEIDVIILCGIPLLLLHTSTYGLFVWLSAWPAHLLILNGWGFVARFRPVNK